ncbi:dnaJ homolog subfamily C member 4 [Thalassophryne amazonica]|uniref:dnaJ homolog subfamily C member 4 n=1 Tax=Thalassophryne amazonica TaxID=390379 RepID=UPI001471343D|nr:dnaJ homolog subfamily C member 4 [Thalassophryne amazonica]
MFLRAQLRICQCCLWCYKSSSRLLSQSSVRRKAVNYYDLLGVKSDATLEEIKNAFFLKSKKLHPDSDPSNPDLHCEFVNLNQAYRVLSKQSSRKEYDLKIKYSYSRDQPFRATSGSTYTASTENQNMRYWKQFHYANQMSAEEQQKQKKKKLYTVFYCIIGMMVSIGIHMLLFRKLQEIHINYMNEKDRVLTKIYNEAKERARSKSFEKQIEVMLKKQAEFNTIQSNGPDK